MYAAVLGQHTVTSKKQRLRAAIGLGAISALALTGCAGGGGATNADGLDTITIVTYLPLESLTFSPEMVAASGGFFEEHGLDVDLQPVQGTPAAVQSVVGGAALMSRSSAVDLMPVMEEGQPLRGVATQAYGTGLHLVSADSDPITSAADMEGKTIGMGSLGGTSENMLDLTLTDGGVDLDSVGREQTQVSAATMELVRNGNIDGYIASMDTALALQDQNEDAVIDTAGLPDFPQVWFAQESSLDNPEEADKVQRALAALQDATEFMIEDADNDFANVIEMLRADWSFPALDGDDEVVVRTLTAYVEDIWVDPSGTVAPIANNPEAWEHAYESFQSTDLVSGESNPDEWLTDDVLPTQ